MLRALLVERFKLGAHMEDRPRQVYALVVDKNGPKFKQTDPASASFMGAHNGQTLFRAAPSTSGVKGSMTMVSLANYLSGRGYGPVQDFTGLKGKYDIDLSWKPDPTFEQLGGYAAAYAAEHPGAELPPGPAADFFTAIRESLGLRLEPRKEPVEMLVIDHIERVPTGN